MPDLMTQSAQVKVHLVVKGLTDHKILWIIGSGRFFEKKLRKKLLLFQSRDFHAPLAQTNKSLLLLFLQKKKSLLTEPKMDQSAAISYIHAMSTSSPDAKKSFRHLGGLSGLIFNPGLFLLTLFKGGYVGQDSIGNAYYERPGRAKNGRTRRWVVYAGAPEASTVGPEWHSWLHHLTDKPLPDTGAKPWQRPHQPNLTGTSGSYRPAGHDYAGGKRARASADYESWTPDQN